MKELYQAHIKVEPNEEMIIEEIIDGQTHVINPPKSLSSSSATIKEEVVFDMDDQPIGNILNSSLGNNGEMHIENLNGNAPVKAEFVENDASDQVGFQFVLGHRGLYGSGHQSLIHSDNIFEIQTKYFINPNTFCNICDCSIDSNKFEIHNSYHHSLPGDSLYNLWFKRSNKYPCAKCLLQFDSKPHIRNHIKNHMIQDYDLNTMQNRMINAVYLDRICSFCGIHITTNPDTSIGVCLGDFIADFLSEQGQNLQDPKSFYMSFVMQYYPVKGSGKEYHTNLGLLRNNLLQFKTSPRANAETDLRRRLKAQGRALIEFLMREHMLRDHGFQLNQDNFDGPAPFKCGQCFRSYFCWNKYQSHQSLHHRNADFVVKRSTVSIPMKRTNSSNVQATVTRSTMQLNPTSLILQHGLLQKAASKKAVIYPNRINLTDGVELVNRLKCIHSFGGTGNRALRSCPYETFFPDMMQHHTGSFHFSV